MRIVAAYKQFADYTREVDEWLDQFERRSGSEVERLDPDMPDGEMFCSSRDILQYPAIVVVDSEGKTYEMWMGTPLPMVDEVMGYVSF